MSNLNSLPDLSTVDIQAIADSGSPVHPRISLPPLTTIAENWDTLVRTENSLLADNEGSCSEDDDDESDEEEEHISKSPGKIRDSKSLRASCSSSSSSSEPDSDSSSSELSDETSDSAGSSTSSSDSDSDSPSSVSSSSCKSRPHHIAKPAANNKDHQSFSVREANYDKGRVTLRLSSLQKLNHETSFHENKQPYSTNNCNILRADKLGTIPNSAFNSVIKSPPDLIKKHESPTRPTAKPSVSVNKNVSPVKRERQLRPRPSPEPTKVEATIVKPIASKIESPKQMGTRPRGRSSSKKLESPSSAVNLKKDDSKANSNKSQKGRTSFANSGSQKESSVASSSLHRHTNSGPSLSDLDTNSSESNLPDVSEAIRLLDLDSQGPAPSDTCTPMSAFHQPGGAPSVAGLRLGFGGSSGVHHAWPSVGYCSSLLQQFVAKSQSGEPPPPPPPTSAVLQLPTKGARKCFPVNDDLLPSVPVDKSFKRSGGDSLRSTFSAAGGSGHVDHDLDTMIPMRGLDIHPSHVSPDSGIQSVSGSPFSVHSSPNHPSGGGSTTCNGHSSQHSNNQQQTASLSSPCPPVSPSPPPQLKKAGKKSGSGRKGAVAAAANTVANDAKVTSSHKNQPPPPAAGAVKCSERRNSSGSRRPRSCRDTASALSSGLGKDSITFQAIQRGIDAARRLTSRNASEEEDVDPKSSISSITIPPQVSASKITTATSKQSKKKDASGKKRGRKPKIAITSAPSVPKDPPSFVSGKEPVLVFPRETVDSASSVAQVNIPKPSVSETILSDLSLKRRKKQKQKKHKSSRQKAKRAPATATIHPTLLTSLDELCRRLHRCAISRSVVAGSRKRLLVFQCRKYNTSHSISAIGGGGGSSSSHGRGKRKKIEDTPISTISASTTTAATSNAVVTGITKRKNKPKKSASQSIQSSHSVSTNAASNSTKPESVPTVNTASSSAKVEEMSTSASMTAVELLLPLKKRHHHLAASDIPVPSIETTSSFKSNSSSNYPASEKPSHNQATAKSTQHQQSSRKRPASKEPEVVNNRTNAEETVPPAKKKRGRKKVKEDNVKMALPPQVEQPLPAKAPSPLGNQISTIHADDNDAVNKKKARRRKTFNRTGFPSAKKKRKKTPTPLPPPFATSSEQTTCKQKSVVVPAVTAPATTGPVATSGPKKPKRPKLSVKEEDSESVVTTEPTSSEAPSGDELNPSSAAAAAVAALVASVKNQKPTKKRSRATNNLRKRYLSAGLLSKYFKEDTSDLTASGVAGTGESTKEVGRVERSKSLTYDPDEHEHGLLPAPYYCERYLRRTRRDFQLPYDLWWQHQEGKLPGRESMVPSWNYRKIRNNVYYDVKPPYTNDAEPCNCTLPPPDATKEEIDVRCCGDDCLNRMVYTECSGQMCPVGDKCMNQRIQRHRWAQGLERFMTTEKGWGVRCRNVLKSGEFILEYVGEVVSDREFKERMHTVYVHDTHHYCLHLDGGLVIDGHRMGGDGRFVNHSCAPNCEMQKWSVNGLPRMALFALRDISPFEELSYDYNFSLFNPAEGQPCKCGSAQCRGVIGGKSQRVNVIQPDAANNKQVVPKANQQKRKRKTGQQGKTPLAVCSLSINPRPLSSQQRAFVLLRRCFLLRNLDKVRDWRDQQKDRMKQAQLQQNQQQNAGRSRRFISRPSLDQSETKEPAAVSSPSIDEASPSASQIKEQRVDPPIIEPPGVCMTMEQAPDENEEVVRCRCRLFDDEGLMVQCERCETWQHSDCFGPEKSKIALEAEHYICHACAGEVLHRNDLNIVLEPQPENPPEGQTYYLSLTHKDMQVRQGDCVYVLRDHDSADSERTLWSCVFDSADLPTPRPPHHLPPHLQLAKLDIFQIERMWIDETGKRFVWGHHFFRPHETFHEPSRKFFVNEVLVSPIYESIPLWAVFGRCWVLDPVTFCKGRPADAIEEHVYICEYRIDRGARLFTKMSRSKFPLCLRSFAFKSFVTKLKPQRTYQPHGAPPPNGRKPIEFSTAAATPSADSLKKSDIKTKIKNKVNKTEVHPPQTSAPPSKTAQKQTKVQQQKLRLDQLLRQLLVKRTPEDSDVLDASHLLRITTKVSKQKSARMRGRPPKNKSDSKGPSTPPSSQPST